MKQSEKVIAEQVQRALNAVRTYGELEDAAGVIDRDAFWLRHPTIESGRSELERLIEQRIRDRVAGKAVPS